MRLCGPVQDDRSMNGARWRERPIGGETLSNDPVGQLTLKPSRENVKMELAKL